MDELNILIGCPVCQKPLILKEFLESLKNINMDGFRVDFLFIDDNKLKKSGNLLKDFSLDGTKIIIIDSMSISKDEDVDKYKDHNWGSELIWRLANFKNIIISHARDNNYDYLFLVDSDILLHPNTITHLIKQHKDIISEVFWTKWIPQAMELPQVWLYDRYTLYEPDPDTNFSKREVQLKIMEFVNKLKIPGVYKVGGLGACTLISRKALDGGVSFSRISNLTLWGEDRHFCVRAAVLGYDLYVDTTYPAYHIYRVSELAGVHEYKIKCGYK